MQDDTCPRTRWMGEGDPTEYNIQKFISPTIIGSYYNIPTTRTYTFCNTHAHCTYVSPTRRACRFARLPRRYMLYIGDDGAVYKPRTFAVFAEYNKILTACHTNII